ncbi:MAG: hypothetical protein ACSNEK_01735 [Parachlamydiaceae bacterium]
MILPLCFQLILGSFGTGSTVSPPLTPLQGPPAPQQTMPKQRAPDAHIDMQLLQEKIKEREKESEVTGPLYVYPGVVRVKDGKWVGYDYLYNLTSNIPVEVTVIKPKEVSVPFTEEAIRDKIANLFEDAGIDTNVNIEGGRPPVAFFNMMVLIYPVNDGFIALTDGRLFETVSVKRVTPAPSEGVLQAMTWEQQNLLVASSESFMSLLNHNIEDIANNFLERYRFFEAFKKRRTEQD